MKGYKTFGILMGCAMSLLGLVAFAVTAVLTLMTAGVMEMGPPPWWLFAPLPIIILIMFVACFVLAMSNTGGGK